MIRNGLLGRNGMHHQKGSCLWAAPKKSDGGRCASFPVRSSSVPVVSDEFAVLGLTPFASKSDVKHAYKRLALKYHPDVIKEDNNGHEKNKVFREIKSAYESLMEKFKAEEMQTTEEYDEYEDEWEEWMGFEGGVPVIYNTT